MEIAPKKREIADRIIVLVTIVSVGYAVLRYNIAGEVPWKDVPVYVFNKGISLASFFLLGLSFSIGPLKNLGAPISDKLLGARKSLGLAGLMLVFVHFILSITILNPLYYDVFFEENGSLSLQGGLSLFGGAMGLVLLWIYYFTFRENIVKIYPIVATLTSKKITTIFFLFVGVHLFFMGYAGWITVDKWQAGLPPISLISFVIFSVGLLLHLVGKK
ncbi:hypothetical protein K8352_06740 [Flavobacteriaceae bacterium F89]|uniref:Ferric oxidoreductase domain-containing protein n=1 Tax=Cerina litoralis TaxID=2874477 RepID=A0AAE3JQN4_9FLAO|nr:hypothetical protein [Cerina litoralis]MCG2460438.1 hypothetical protein [Cerina litoralis]